MAQLNDESLIAQVFGELALEVGLFLHGDDCLVFPPAMSNLVWASCWLWNNSTKEHGLIKLQLAALQHQEVIHDRLPLTDLIYNTEKVKQKIVEFRNSVCDNEPVMKLFSLYHKTKDLQSVDFNWNSSKQIEIPHAGQFRVFEYSRLDQRKFLCLQYQDYGIKIAYTDDVPRMHHYHIPTVTAKVRDMKDPQEVIQECCRKLEHV